VTFAAKLRELRGDETQQQVADRAGIPLPTFRGLEQGQRSPSWRNVVRLARAFNHTSAVFDDCDEVNEPEVKAKAKTTKGVGKRK
jgi:transcriptional regulator with XRE-family HTH domain